MITLKRAKSESRNRDRKRNRFILVIGNKVYHITKKEAVKLGRTIEGYVKK